MKVVALIPARYHSTRFPGKMLAPLNGKPLIYQTYQTVVQTGLFNDVIVITDYQEIFDILTALNTKVMMSSPDHESGSDRIAEATEKIDADIIVNVQGDEPFITKAPLEKLLTAFSDDKGDKVDVASIMKDISFEEAENPNIVKVVTDKDGFALYFSRSVIPYDRDKNQNFNYKGHIGVYAYKRAALLNFPKLAPTSLETCEKLEQLRLLENGYKIRMVNTSYNGIGIDTKEDYEKAKIFFNK